jgi:hypothetical protein
MLSTRLWFSFLEQARGVFVQQTGDPVATQQLAWQARAHIGIARGLFSPGKGPVNFSHGAARV